MSATFAPVRFEWQGGGGAEEPFGLLLAALVSLPLLALHQLPRFFSPRLSLDRRRFRFGPRSRPVERIKAFSVEAAGNWSSQLALDDDLGTLVILECRQPQHALHGLRDTLNEGLFVVREPPPPELKARTPYRG